MSSNQTAKRAGVGLGLAAVLAVGAHAGALGDDVMRASRNFTHIGRVEPVRPPQVRPVPHLPPVLPEIPSEVQLGLDLLDGLRKGDDAEKQIARVACYFVDSAASGDLGVQQWKAKIYEQLGPIYDPFGRVDSSVEKAATALEIYQRNPRLAYMYVQKCGLSDPGAEFKNGPRGVAHLDRSPWVYPTTGAPA